MRTFNAEAQRKAGENAEKGNGSTLSHQIIGAAIEVHRHLGPGLLESVYESALATELGLRGIQVRRQVELPVHYKEKRLEGALRIDLLVADRIIVETKSIEHIQPVHEAQLLSYLRMAGLRLGLLINFNVTTLRTGIRRIANDL
jgi:GxxExxY protein